MELLPALRFLHYIRSYFINLPIGSLPDELMTLLCLESLICSPRRTVLDAVLYSCFECQIP
ncbi:hypothetical protein Peur_044405 [Populus x canadensis]